MVSKLEWCKKQKRGIKLVTPSESLYEAYMKKAKEALKAVKVNLDGGIVSWAISASYYAKYFAVCALISRIGIKSEIHECTIEVFEFLFKDKINRKYIIDLKRSKNTRIEIQYYLGEVRVDEKKLIQTTREFINEIEKLVEKLSEEEISLLRKKLEV
ncbi:MAG: HEPN domain-containing protein [Candidatus Aenigmarchaeota archaeon]|nr:HEPN domain-containing protein [Candidatus Aenigmarchaeota archaeon]